MQNIVKKPPYYQLTRRSPVIGFQGKSGFDCHRQPRCAYERWLKSRMLPNSFSGIDVILLRNRCDKPKLNRVYLRNDQVNDLPA